MINPSIEIQLKQAQDLLKIHYGYSSFRPGQEEVIKDIFAGKNTVVIMPTGGGKSLCYQLPALLLDGITIVVSPLIALMKDQVDSLNKIGIPATFVNSSLSLAEAENRLKNLSQGGYKLLYIAPERFYNQEFVKALSQVKVSLFAIDEAHCISHWGHDFRPSYMRIKHAVALLGNPVVTALTATATPEVKADIIKQLDLVDPEVIITGFKRPNLQFGVLQTSKNMKARLVLDAISSVPDTSGIVYVGTRNKAEELVQYLTENNIEAATYHAGMDGESRKWIQDNFMSGKIKVIVATNAFGMGIDKSDIKFVIHHDLPGTIEAYYQEAGRAGRNGQPSFCLLIYSPSDRYLQEFFIKGDNPPPEVIQEIYMLLLSYETDRIFITYSEIAKNLSDDIPEMAVGTSIKILEQSGYLRRSTEKNANAFLKFSAQEEDVRKAIGAKAKVQIKILEKLLEKYASELYSGWQVNFEELSDIHNFKKDSIIRLIKKLSDLNLAEYRPPFRGTEILMLKKDSAGNLDIDFSALREKQKNAYAKLDKIEEYVYHTGCRQSFILEYFGEKEVTDCQHCDICLAGPKPDFYTKKYTRTYANARHDDFDLHVKPPEEKSGLGTKLTQIETYELFGEGKTLEEIAQIRNLKPATITEHLCFLIKTGKDINIDKIVKTHRQKEITDVIKKFGSDKLAPIKETLGDDYSWDEIKLTLAKYFA
jgi:ATP-dependent DNA helicase RecQ